MTSSSKYRARRSSCSPLNAPPPSLTLPSPLLSVPRSAGDVQDLRRDILGPAAAANRDVLDYFLDELLEVEAEPRGGLPGHLRLDKPRGGGFHRSAAGAELDREGLGEALE